jgi:hypothetical protein
VDASHSKTIIPGLFVYQARSIPGRNLWNPARLRRQIDLIRFFFVFSKSQRVSNSAIVKTGSSVERGIINL